MYRTRKYTDRGATLTELAAAIAIAFVIALVAGVTIEMSNRETHAALMRVETSRNVFATVQSIENNVMRAEEIAIPDPDFPDSESIQMLVPLSSGTVRRAFRVEDGWLVVDYKDESDAPYQAFANVTSLTFTSLDPPTDSLIQIACTTTINGKSIQMQTVAKKRN